MQRVNIKQFVGTKKQKVLTSYDKPHAHIILIYEYIYVYDELRIKLKYGRWGMHIEFWKEIPVETIYKTEM
jgi:hypothetical protein